MQKSFKLSILTPEKTVYTGDIVSLVAPAQRGYLGVLANHAPLMANTVPGTIRFKESSQRTVVMSSKGKGFLEIDSNNVTLLLDKVEREKKAVP